MKQNVLQRFMRNRMAVAGAVILACVGMLTALAPLAYPEGAFTLAGQPLLPPGQGGFLLGTDTLGRNVAAGLAHGARTSLLIGIVAALSAVTFGSLVGALAGYYRGYPDMLLMRMTEFFQTIPNFILSMLLIVILSPSIRSVIIAISAVSWPGIARLVRGEFIALGGREFVLASTSLGAGSGRIIFRHLLPNCVSSVIAVGSLLVASAILMESGLAFMGLSDPNMMSWGMLIAAGRTSLRTAWWISIFPGIAILLTVLAINLVGDGLNEVFNPRLREQ